MALSRLRIEAQKERNEEEKKRREAAGQTIGEASRLRQEAQKEQEAKKAAGIPTSLPTFSELRSSGSESLRNHEILQSVSRNANRNPVTTQTPDDSDEQMRDANLKDILWNSLKQGYYNSRYGEESYDRMMGVDNEADKYRDILSGDDYRFRTDNAFEQAVSGAMTQIGQMARQYTNPRSLGMATAAGGAALLAGQAGPQVLAPEELLTVPGAMALGFQTGSAMSNFEIEGGLAYQEMLDLGVSPETARVIGLAVGGGNAALEALQLDELMDGLKVAKKTGGMDNAAGVIWDVIKKRFPGVANNVAQEVGQEGVTITGAQLGSKIDKGEWAYDAGEVAGRLGDTALSSMLTFGALDVPGASMNVAAQLNANKQYSKIGSDYQSSAEDLVNEGLSFAPESEAYQTAQEVKTKMDAGEAVTDADLGRVVVANERTMQAEERLAQANRPVETLEEVAHEAVQAERGVSVEDDTSPTPVEMPAREAVSAKESAPYNVMAESNPVRQAMMAKQKGVQETTGYGKHGASTFANIVETTNTDPGKVRMEFQSAYEAGLTNLPREHASLRSSIQEEAYNAGRLDYIADMSKPKSAAVVRKDAGFGRANLPKDVTEAQYKAVDMLAKAAGVKVRMAKGLKGNAEIAADGTVLIDETFQRKVNGQKRSIVFYAAHEIGMHRLMQLAPSEGRAFINAVIRDANSDLAYGTATVTEKRQAAYAEQDVYLDTASAMEEVAADSILGLYDSEDAFYQAIDRIVNGKDEQAKNGARKFKEILDDIVRKLKKAIAKLTGKERAEAQQTLSEVEQLRDMYEKALKAAVEKTANAPTRAVDPRGKIDTKLSAKEDAYDAEGRRENRKAFVERNERRGWKTQTFDGTAVAYVPVSRDDVGGIAERIQRELSELGIRSFYHDGLQANIDGTTRNMKGEAHTIPGHVVGINTKTTKNAKEVAGHEAFHYWLSSRGEFEKILTDNIQDYAPETVMFMAETVLLYEENGHIDNALLHEEFRARIAGMLHADRRTDGLRKMLRDYDAVKAAWNELVAKNTDVAKYEVEEFSDVLTTFSLRTKEPPKKTGIAYKVFYAKDGQLYPPMVPNPGGVGTPVGVWLDADVGEAAEPSKTGRPQVQAGGKGTNAGKMTLAFRPGWHLGDLPMATQFARKNPETGVKDLFPADFVWAECEYAMDHDYQDEAMSYGYTENGKFRHSYAGLPRLPEDGYYRYRTNPNPDTVPWVITGAMRVKRILTDAETDKILRDAGVEPMKRQGGPINLEKLGIKAGEQFGDSEQFSLKIDTEGLPHDVEQEAKDVVNTLKRDKMMARYGGRKYASYTGSRIDGELEESMVEGIADYAHSYIAWVDPLDFLHATTTSAEYRERIRSEAGELRLDELRDNEEPIYLIVNEKNGEVVGHEGRHRMTALMDSGIDRVAVIVRVTDRDMLIHAHSDKYNGKLLWPKQRWRLNGQQFDTTRGASLTLRNLLPLSERYADAARELFSEVEGSTQFSLKSPVEETKTLIALHNLTDDKLRKALALGGFPMPSIAVTRMDIPHTNFGDITLVMNKSTVDPKASRKNTVYSADAWTPVFPKVEYEVDSRIAHEFYDKARKAEGRIPAEYVSKVNMMASSIESYVNTYESEEGVVERFKDEYAIKALYLAEQGERVETKTRENRTEKANSPMLDAVLDVFDEDVETLRTIPLGELHDKYAEDIKRALVEHGRTEAAAEAMVAKKGGVFGFSKLMAKVLNYAREPEFTVETVTDTKAIEADIDSRIDEAAYDEWLREMFRGLILDSGIHNGKDIYTASGNRKSFKQTHYPVTLENVAKAMAAQNGGNSKHVSGFVGIKSLRAGTAVRFKSIAHMHELEGRLKHLTQEEADAINDALGKRLSEITERIYNKKKHSAYSNQFIEYDTIGNILMEVTELDKYTVDSIQKVFSQYQYNLGNQLAADIRDLLFDVTQMPVNIYEAKPERAVRFDEVLAAVLPDNADQRLRKQLEQMGLNVLTYTAGDDASRIEAVNSVDGAKFSLKGQSDLLEENAKLKKVYSTLREQFSVTRFEKADKATLDKFAKDLLKDWKSTADIDETREALDNFYTFVREFTKSDDPDFAELEKQAYAIATPIVENVVEIDDTEYQEYKELRNYIRTTGITLPKDLEHDLGEYESLNDFRKAYFGRIRLVKGGREVSSFYEELAGMYPGLFDVEEHSNPADQLVHIGQVLDDLKPTEVNPHSHNMREVTTWLATDIISRLYDLPQAKPTFGDKVKGKVPKAITGGLDEMGSLLDEQQARLERAETEGRRAQRELAEAKSYGNALITSNKQLKRELEQAKADVAKIIEASRKKQQETIAGQRMAAGREMEKLKRKQKEKLAKASETKQRQVMRAKILRHTTQLSKKLLHASDRNHIPQELQGIVAKLLESINMESNYTYDSQTDSYKKNDLGSPTMRTRLFSNLRKTYGELANELTIDPDLLGDDGLLAEVIGMADLRMADMTLPELETVWKAIRAIEASIQSADITFNQSRWGTISEAANALRAENADKKDKLELDGPGGSLGKLQKLTGIDMMTPEAYFHRLGKSGDALFRMMRDAQDDHIRKMKEVSDFTHEALKGVNVKKLENQMHTVKLGGQDVKLSTAQIMELYVLLNREQAREHIMLGGILPDVVSKGGLKKISRAEPVRGVQMSELLAAFRLLSEEQIAVAKKLQDYASTELSKWGNEAAMKVYNYEKFGEKAYWPIRVNKQEVQSNVQKDTQVTSVGGRGFTKGTKPHANNSVRIGSIFDTFATHSSEMATYAAWLAPMEDINRIRNYTFKEAGATTGTVKGIIDRVHGKNGTTYLAKLMADLSNGVKGTHGETAYMSALVGNYKAASVGANLRVIIQQPTAMLRAMDMIGPQYLVAGMRPANGWKKAKQYAPIAQWKDWGYFDINTGRQMKDVLFDSDSALDKVKSASMWGAGAADSLSWGILWNAVETETRHKHKDLKGEDFYKAVAERFNEIVDHTQVVDGILQRSQIMRSADGLTKMATSFMGEPTKQYNMMMGAAYDATHGNRDQRRAGKKRFMRAAVTLAISGVANAMAQAIMDAVRDDDREKDYWEKWFAQLTGISGDEETTGELVKNVVLEGNLGGTFNPATYIPFVKDIVSIIQGYDVSRMDMESIEKTLTASKNMIQALSGEGKYTIGSASAALFAEVARMAGVPVANFKREVKSFAMLAANETDNYLMQYRMEKASLNMNYSSNGKTFMDILFKAYQNDQEAYEIIYEDMIADGYDPDKLASAMETRMKKAEGVDSVNELTERFLHPDQKSEYDSKMANIQRSGLWSDADWEQRDELEEKMYHLVTDSKTGQEIQEKIDEGKSYGLSETDYLLYNLALDIYDQPNKNGELGGPPTSEEKAAAINSLGELSDGEIAFLWDTEQGFEAYAAGLDMEAIVNRIGSGDDVNIDKLIEMRDYDIDEQTYFDFRDALKEVDQPTKSGKMGSYTQDEAAAAIASLPGLSNAQRAALWQSMNKSWKPKNNPWR